MNHQTSPFEEDKPGVFSRMIRWLFSFDSAQPATDATTAQLLHKIEEWEQYGIKLEAKIEVLSADNRKKDEEIELLRKTSPADVREKDEQIVSQKNEIALLQDQITVRNTEIAQLGATILEKDRQINSLIQSSPAPITQPETNGTEDLENSEFVPRWAHDQQMLEMQQSRNEWQQYAETIQSELNTAREQLENLLNAEVVTGSVELKAETNTDIEELEAFRRAVAWEQEATRLSRENSELSEAADRARAALDVAEQKMNLMTEERAIHLDILRSVEACQKKLTLGEAFVAASNAKTPQASRTAAANLETINNELKAILEMIPDPDGDE